jgi:Arylsulfotransferase (ASST)
MLDFRSFQLRLLAMACAGAVGGCAPGGSGGTTGSGAAGSSGTGSAGNSGGGASGATGGGAGTGQAGGSGGSSVGGSTGAAGVSGSPGRGGGSGATGAAGTGVGGSTGAAGTGAGGSGGAVAITGLKIDPNPNSVLSCFVSWTTNTAASSAVQFGQNGYQWEITDAALVTSHRVLVIGMHAQQTYQIKAISGSASATGMFMTGTLPAQIPSGTVMINDTARSQPGWTLMNVQKGQGPNSMYMARSNDPPYAVMYDSGGLPVWYYVDGTMPDVGGAVSTQLTDKGVLIGPTWNAGTNIDAVLPIEVDFAGNMVWQCSACANKNFTHHASKLSNGDYMVIEYIMNGTRQDPIFREVNASNQVVWSLDYAKLVTPPSGASGDWCHGNAITVDLTRMVVYANCRWAGLLKASYAPTPARQWLLTGTPKGAGVPTVPVSDVTFSPTSSAFSDTHDPEIHDDGTICFFDNGGYSGAAGGSTSMFRSRAVEYMINDTAKTATLTWEFPAGATVPDAWYTNNWYTPFWGDVDRLPNGNYLVAAGIRSITVESRVFEVTKSDKKVVWEFRFPPDYGVYRADRITPPLVHPIN